MQIADGLILSGQKTKLPKNTDFRLCVIHLFDTHEHDTESKRGCTRWLQITSDQFIVIQWDEVYGSQDYGAMCMILHIYQTVYAL